MIYYLQCFSTLRLNATFSSNSVQTGFVKLIFARSALAAITFPPVDNDPIFTSSNSVLVNFWT